MCSSARPRPYAGQQVEYIWQNRFAIAVMGVRTVLEKRTLRAEREGYDAYAAKVRYRPTPHIG